MTDPPKVGPAYQSPRTMPSPALTGEIPTHNWMSQKHPVTRAIKKLEESFKYTFRAFPQKIGEVPDIVAMASLAKYPLSPNLAGVLARKMGETVEANHAALNTVERIHRHAHRSIVNMNTVTGQGVRLLISSYRDALDFVGGITPDQYNSRTGLIGVPYLLKVIDGITSTLRQAQEILVKPFPELLVELEKWAQALLKLGDPLPDDELLERDSAIKDMVRRLFGTTPGNGSVEKVGKDMVQMSKGLLQNGIGFGIGGSHDSSTVSNFFEKYMKELKDSGGKFMYLEWPDKYGELVNRFVEDGGYTKLDLLTDALPGLVVYGLESAIAKIDQIVAAKQHGVPVVAIDTTVGTELRGVTREAILTRLDASEPYMAQKYRDATRKYGGPGFGDVGDLHTHFKGFTGLAGIVGIDVVDGSSEVGRAMQPGDLAVHPRADPNGDVLDVADAVLAWRPR